MPDECRPPSDTPNGTTCWLYYDPPAGPREWIALRWFGGDVWSGVFDAGVNRATRLGWRFHSIAEVPHD